MALTRDDIHSLQHALGITDGKKEYRNYYAASPNDPQMKKLVSLGLMRPGRIIPGGLRYFYVTECGRELAYQELDRPKLTKGQIRYLRYLDAADVHDGLTFKKFLTDPYYKESRT